MKFSKTVFLLLTLVLSLSFSFEYSRGASSDQEGKVDLWLVLRLRDYKTDMPISNTSVAMTFSTVWGKTSAGPVFTNETGIVQLFLGKVVNLTSTKPPTLQEFGLSNNYTLIKVQDSFIEGMQYSAEYVVNYTQYTGLQVNLIQKPLKNQTFIEVNLWVLSGKLVKVSDSDPVTGTKKSLTMKPAVKAVVKKGSLSEYESYYFFPLEYDVTIVNVASSSTETAYAPFKAIVDENTTLINWTYQAAKEYVNRETRSMDEAIGWLTSFGFPLDREIEESDAVRTLLTRILDLYQRREYGPALGGAMISADRLKSLESWLSSFKTYAVLTSLGVILFVYGFASLIPNFIFEEPSDNKIRLISKVLLFSLLMVVFSLSHPSLKLTYAVLIGSIIGTVTPIVDLPITLLGAFIVGALTYFFITLMSIKQTALMNLAMQLGMRSLKRRPSRTILTLVTITIIVSSAIVFVNISASRATRIKDSWKGTETPGVLITPDVELSTLTEYDINWTRTQEWCKDLGYTEEIKAHEWRGMTEIVRYDFLMIGDRSLSVDIVGVDPVFMDKYYNLSTNIRGIWQEFTEGKIVAIIPNLPSFSVSTSDYVTLTAEEWSKGRDAMTLLGTIDLGSFRVVGKYDPSTLSKLTNIDGSPLFKDTSKLVLVPLNAITDPSMIISDVTVIIGQEADPVSVAENMAYQFGVPTVANKNGLAMRIEWSLELSAVGLIPYLFPLVIASLMVYITMVSVYEERKREFTTLATLGLDPKNTFQIFTVEALLLGLMGTFFGFFGSYILVIASFYATNLLGLYGASGPSLSYANWSIPAILVALLTGVVMVFLGGYIPAMRAQGLSLMGRVKRRRLIGELVSEGNVTHFPLPIKETVQDSEMLYTYLRETIGKFRSSLVDPHSVKGEIYGDGSFKVSFFAIGPAQSALVPCEVKGVREGSSLVPVIEFPTGYKSYERMRDILRDLEEYMIGFSTWKEMQLKMKIVREAPKRRKKTLEEITTEIKDVIAQIKESNKKLKILDAQKTQLSEEIYDEFRQKYISMIDEKSKSLRSMAIGLEPYHNQFQQEIKKIEVEVERVTTAYNLGEIAEEEYVKTCGPMQGRLATLKGKVKELEEIFEFLKMPSRLT